MNPDDAVLAQIVAGHFEGSTHEGATAYIGLGGVAVDCHVDEILDHGSSVAAALWLRLRGGPLPNPVWVSATGVESDARRAIVLGGCNWSCVFGPVLRAALTGAPEPEAEEYDAEVHGRPVRVVLSSLDRRDGMDDKIERARQALGGAERRLTLRIARSGTLPPMTDAPRILSVFVCEAPSGRTVEVMVDGAAWPPSAQIFDAVPLTGGDTYPMMRELAVLVPR